MRALPTSKTKRFTRPIPIALAIFAALAVFSAISSPSLRVKAQDAADSPQAPNAYRPLYDFTGDNKTDFANVTFPAASGGNIKWKVLRNPAPTAPGAAFIRIFDFGVDADVTVASDDRITAADFIGDAKTDISIWRAGNFYTTLFPEGPGPIGALTVQSWGAPTGENLGRDGDYDGDGKDDYTTVRLSGGLLTWVYKGSAGVSRSVQFGASVAGRSTLAFQGADFTGDGRDEFVFCTASTSTGANTYWVGDSITGAVILSGSWGNFITDYFINPDDYTGDGKADLACFRAGGSGADAAGWFIRDTATGALVPPVIFGIADAAFLANDAPVRGNFDGDLKADIAVWRPSTGTYYWIRSSDGIVAGQQWGDPATTFDFTEFPLPTLFCF